MKLNIDLIKSLLAIIEESPDYPEPTRHSLNTIALGITPFANDCITDAEARLIFYHFELLIDGGLIDGEIHVDVRERCISYEVYIDRLTWEGHAFLANAQNATVWERFKSVSRHVGSFSLDVAKLSLAGIAQQQVMQAAASVLQ